MALGQIKAIFNIGQVSMKISFINFNPNSGYRFKTVFSRLVVLTGDSVPTLSPSLLFTDNSPLSVMGAVVYYNNKILKWNISSHNSGGLIAH